MTWEEHQKWEAEWHGNCVNSLGEEMKQLTYAKRMGLRFHHDGKSPYCIDMGGKSVVDIGGGPCSLLLKCVNVDGVVVDSCEYPCWIYARYDEAKIGMSSVPAESFLSIGFDEAWIYNCAQHVQDPEKVFAVARRCAEIVRVFEWIDIPESPGHPHMLTEDKLNEWLGGFGKVETINENTAVGRCYYGVFKGHG